jgi:hypothetical protein
MVYAFQYGIVQEMRGGGFWNGLVYKRVSNTKMHGGKRMEKYHVEIHHDDEDGVWYSTCKDVPGFAAEASSLEALMHESYLTIYNLLGISEFTVKYTISPELWKKRDEL